MGLDYSYLLYFKRHQLWDALQGLAAIAEAHQPPTRILFPDHELAIPFDSWLAKGEPLQHDDPEFSFSIVLRFEEDDAILDYIYSLGRDVEDSGPSEDKSNLVPIGYIYLTIYNDLSRRISLDKASDLVLFDFGTTGTRMSTLFMYSTSIRSTFAGLLERYHGLCGVFNREDGGGEVFWLNGRRLSVTTEDAYLTPAEIEDLLKKGGQEGEDER